MGLFSTELNGPPISDRCKAELVRSFDYRFRLNDIPFASPLGPIVAYDRFHKSNPVSPIMMRACSMLICFAVAAATGDVPEPV